MDQSALRLDLPVRYNAAQDLMERNLRAGRAHKTAYLDDRGSYSFGWLAERSDRFAHALGRLGVQAEQRILLCLLDTIDFPVVFLGAIKAGVIPVPVNTLLRAEDYAHLLEDSRAVALVVSESLLAQCRPASARAQNVRNVIVSGADVPPPGCVTLDSVLAEACPPFAVADTRRDETCFWLYSSGSTGQPKGAMHAHSSLAQTAVQYATNVLGLREADTVFSAAKLFFAYGLGNALTFPLYVGATAILMAGRPTPQAVLDRITTRQPTIFCGVPTLFASVLAHAQLPARHETALRLCTSAGEALPEDVARRWRVQFGVDILDGIGSTEMLHIFLSNRPDDTCFGTLGTAVPGYALRILGEDGQPVAPGEVGELYVSGHTSALGYWGQRDRSRATFQGDWTRTGDKFRQRDDGRYVFAGRSDDMLKVGGIYVSPIEVESALVAHPAVQECAVVGREDAQHLTKPAAYVVLAPGVSPTPALRAELQAFVKARLAPFKYPRWLHFVAELPKTATGKVQRFRLRADQHPRDE